jgi:AcrR family transcriptional regulator
MRAADYPPGLATTYQRIALAALRVASRTSRGRPVVVDICTEAGVSRGTFYRYFRSDAEIDAAMAALATQALAEDVARTVERAVRSNRDPVVAVADGLTRHFTGTEALAELLRRRPQQGIVMLSEILPDAAAAVAPLLHRYRGGSGADNLAQASMLVRMAAVAAVCPRPGDRQLLRRAANAGHGGLPETRSAQAS